MTPGAIVGAALAACAFDVGFVTGRSAFWARPKNDFNAYLVAWQYFLHDRWRIPLFDLPNMGYPEGGSVLFNDALPIGVLPSKIVHSLFGISINPYGIWLFLCWVLLGAFASRAIVACGVRVRWAVLAGSFLTITKALFMWRLGHVGISAHFLIIWALALYVENTRDARFTFPEHLLLSAITILTNAYLVGMVGVIQAATVLTLVVRKQFCRRDWLQATSIAVVLTAVALIEGYGALFHKGLQSMRAGGFGHFSWNVPTLIVPIGGFWGPSLIVRDATGGQYEGDGYLGAGVVILAVTLLFAHPLKVLRALGEYWVLTAAIVGCMLFAASDHIYFGSHLVLAVPLPAAALDAAAFFRASARFIWPAAYAISIFSLVGSVLWLKESNALIVMLLAVTLQGAETRLAIPMVTAVTKIRQADLVDGDQMVAWLTAHRRLFQYPSYSCGSLVPNSTWGGPEANRELRIQLIAARLGRPSNSVYTSRQLKNCGAELQWAENPSIKSGVLYLVNHAPERMTPALWALVRSPMCLDVGYAYVCSYQPLPILSEQTPEPLLSLHPAISDVCQGSPQPTVTAVWHRSHGRPVEVRIGSPDGRVVATGVSGSVTISVPVGTNVYLVPHGQSEAIDVETTYGSARHCGRDVPAAGVVQ
jgi:hypothetical protein